jgi:hypothetical protein
VDVTAGEALIREVQRSAAMVEWPAVRVAALPEDDLTWGLAGRRITRPGRRTGSRPSTSSSAPGFTRWC